MTLLGLSLPRMDKNRWYWTCQVLGWATLMSVTAYFYISRFQVGGVFLLNVLLNIGLGIGLTHYYRKYALMNHWLSLNLDKLVVRVIAAVVLMSLIMTIINIPLDSLTVPEMAEIDFDNAMFIRSMFLWGSYFAIWTLTWHLYILYDQLVNTQKERLKMQAILKESAFQNLKSQLNPHFLFNSLNSIRAMVDDEPEQAKDAINKLSSLLRSSLSLAKSKTVNTIVELQTVKNYIELEKIRFEDRLDFHYHVEDKTVYLPVPPMMLQTLVENAVKHGISKQKNGGFIALKSVVEKGEHVITIRNTGQLPTDVEGRGYGIANTLERLRLVFNGKATFKLTNDTNETVLTEIKIPLYESDYRG